MRGDSDVRYIHYLLAVGIYLQWSVFAKPLPRDQNKEKKDYFVRQESIRENIERCFGILNARFEIMRENLRWDELEVVWISNVYDIFNNMLVRMVQCGVVGEDIVDVITKLLEEGRKLGIAGAISSSLDADSN